MTALKMEDLKAFTSGLFVGNVFDKFLVREATIVTFNTFTIDGHIKPGYYSEEEAEERQVGELSTWEAVKPICFSLIKGKKLPNSFQITLQLPPAEVETVISVGQAGIRAEQISGLYLNIRYEDAVLACITGTSLNIFTMDKTIEREWDEAVRRFLKQARLAYSEDY